MIAKMFGKKRKEERVDPTYVIKKKVEILGAREEGVKLRAEYQGKGWKLEPPDDIRYASASWGTGRISFDSEPFGSYLEAKNWLDELDKKVMASINKYWEVIKELRQVVGETTIEI